MINNFFKRTAFLKGSHFGLPGLRTISRLVLNVWAIPFFFLLSLCGCAGFLESVKIGAVKANKPINFFFDADAARNIRRVLVMPVRNISGIKGIEESLYSALTLELSKLKSFDVVTFESLSTDQMRACESLFPGSEASTAKEDKNFSSEDFLKALSVDAILYPEIVHYRPYKSLALHYKQSLVSLASRQILWSVDEVLDMADKDVNGMAKGWYQKRNQNDSNPSLKSDVMEISMASFVQFSLAVFCETWGETAA